MKTSIVIRNIKNLFCNTNASISPSSLSDRSLEISKFKLCVTHRNALKYFCLTCNKNLCNLCLKQHLDHKLTKTDELIIPSKKQITELKTMINKYNNKFNELLKEIKKWKNVLDLKIQSLEKCISNNELFDFINEYSVIHIKNSNDQKSIIKFNEIFSRINDQYSNDYIKEYQKNPGAFYNYHQFLQIKFILTQVELNKENCFYNNGNEFIKFLKDIPETVEVEDKIKTMKIKIGSMKSILKNIDKNKINRTNSFDDKNILQNIFKRNENEKLIYAKRRNLISSRSSNFSDKEIKSILKKPLISRSNSSIYTKKYIDKENIDTTNISDNSKINCSRNLISSFNSCNSFNTYDKNNNNTSLRNSKSINRSLKYKNILHCSNLINDNNKNNNNKKKYFVHKKLNPSLNINYNIYGDIKKKIDKNISGDIPLKIVKNTKEKIYKINPYTDLSLGLELDDLECKLSLLNQTNNDIELFYFDNENNLSVPTTLFLSPEKENILIGKHAKNQSIINPKQTIFHLIKIFAYDFDELQINKILLPFDIYKDKKNGKTYLTLDYNNQKNQKFYIEDLLKLYLIELFKLFLNKIVIESKEGQSTTLNLNICITIPNYFNYFARKKLENLFKNSTFEQNLTNFLNFSEKNEFIATEPSATKSLASTINTTNKKYVNTKIINLNIKKIKLENCSSIPSLCLSYLPKNNSNSNNNNVLILNISGDSFNISIVSINNKKKFEIKTISTLNVGEENITENFLLNNILKEFDSKNYLSCISDGTAIMKLINTCELSKKAFQKQSQIEIKIKKLFDDIDLKMTLSKNDYNNSCNFIFTKIISLIKETISNAQLTEMDIDDILLIGYTARYNEKLRSMICELFKHNRMLFNKNNCFNYSGELSDNNDFYAVAAAAYQFSTKLNYCEICPMSFGIKNYKGENIPIVNKGDKIPIKKSKKIILGKNLEILELSDYKSKVILCDKGNNLREGYTEELIMFEVDRNLNLVVSVLNKDGKSKKKEFIVDEKCFDY